MTPIILPYVYLIFYEISRQFCLFILTALRNDVQGLVFCSVHNQEERDLYYHQKSPSKLKYY